METTSQRFAVEAGAVPLASTVSLSIPDHQLLRRIGGGSYGEVWLARCVLGHYRAIKIVRRGSFEEDRPFEREFEGICKFEPISRQYESQVDILQVGRVADGFYYVMELADDVSRNRSSASPTPALDPASYVPKTLKIELARRSRLPLEECLDIALTLTTALQHLHDQGLVHRDIKPSNIIFVGGAPKLADLGLVTGMDATHSFVGTEGYIPPEGSGTPQADLYSLGKVLYEISTGRPREDFPEPSTCWEEGANGLAWPEFFEVVLKACEPSPQRRYQSAREMRAELALLQSGKSVRQVHTLERRLAVARQVGVVASVALLLVLTASLFASYQHQQVRAEARRADQEAGRARQAEAQARLEQWKAHLAEARAWRWSGLGGRRFEGLAALRKAAAIRPALELRNEAMACFALADLQTTSEKIFTPPEAVLGDFDSSYEHYAFAETNGQVVVSRLSDHRELARWGGFAPPFPVLRLTPDGRRLVIGSGDAHPRVEVWQIAPQEPVLRLDPAVGRTLDCTADSRWLAVALQGPGFPIHVYDLASRERLASFDHGTLPWTIRFHPKQPSLLLTSDQSPAVRLWDWKTGRTISTFTFANWVAGLDWHPEGRCFAAAGGDGRVWLWDTIAHQPRVGLAGHQGAAVNVSFTPDGHYLASRGWDGMLYLWDFAAAKEVVHTPISGFICDFGRTTGKLGYSLDTTNVGVFEVAAPLGFHLLRQSANDAARSGRCAFSPDGELLLSAHEDSVRIWDAGTGRELATAPGADPDAFLEFAEHGRCVFTDTPAGVLRRPVELESARQGLTLGASEKVFVSLGGGHWSLSGDARTLGFCAADGIRMLDLGSGQPQEPLRLQPGRVLPVHCDGLALNSNGSLAATWVRSTPRIEVWEVARSEKVRELPVQRGARAAFSPDGQWLATGDWGEYRVWNLTNWTVHYSLRREVGGYDGVIAFSPDSRVMAIAFARHTVRLVEPATGLELATLRPPGQLDVGDLVFSADGSRLAIPAGAGPIQLWDLRLVRAELARMNLDWSLPPFPPATLLTPGPPSNLR